MAELRMLIDQLEQIKVDSAATVGAARSMADEQKGDETIGEQLLRRGKGSDVPIETVLAEYMKPFSEVQAGLGALQARRAVLFEQVRKQHELFVRARGAASSFEARQAYFRTLLHGAEEVGELHAGLTEGRNFYQTIRAALKECVERAMEISDTRKDERRRLIAATKFGSGQSTSSGAQATAAAATTAAATSAAAMAATASQRPQAAAAPAPPLYSSAMSQPYNPAMPYANAPSYPQQAYPQQPYPGQPYPQQAYPQQASASAFAQPAVAQPSYPQSTPRAPQQPAVAHAQPARAQPQAASTAPKKIACYQCRQHFGVPPGSAVVACPFCRCHNRVPQ